jgi:hypothetical protein
LQKKKQKNSCFLGVAGRAGQTPTVNKSFLHLFFKKEALSDVLRRPAWPENFCVKILSQHCNNADKISRPDSILSKGVQAVEQIEYTSKLEELDHLLNDPDVSLEPDRVWMLLAELSRHDLNPVRAAGGVK